MTDIAKRLREMSLGVSMYGAPDKDLLARRIEAIAAELESQPAGDPAMPRFGVLWVHGGGLSIVWSEDGEYVFHRDAMAAIAAARQERVPDDADAQSKAMLVARLEAMSRSGDTWLTIPSVLALINDCDMLAARAAPKPSPT